MNNKAHRRLWWILGALLVLIIVGYAYWCDKQPLPDLLPTSSSSVINSPAAGASLSWPTVGQSAVGVAGTNILVTHGAGTPEPTASTAKLITALAVLHEKPLTAGESGPIITLGPSDVALYNAYVAEDGSVVQVVSGEQISEYQLLQGMLLPSANNFADSLAIWAFGSLANYTAYANNYLKQLGLNQTHVGSDASGFLPTTTSTAADLVRLGELSMQNPIISGIVDQPTATGLPVVGTIKNVNYLLGQDNIIGIKTGNSNQAGGVYLSAAKVTVNAQPVEIVTSLVAAPTLVEALNDSVPLIQSAQANFKSINVVSNGATVGSYKLPWGGSDPVIASTSLPSTAWGGDQAAATLSLSPIKADTQSGAVVGSLQTSKLSFVAPQSVNAVLAQTPSQPSLWWRLIHPNKL